jgi:hypothetical protein
VPVSDNAVAPEQDFIDNQVEYAQDVTTVRLYFDTIKQWHSLFLPLHYSCEIFIEI